MENMTLRFEARKRGVPMKDVAEELGISRGQLYRNLNKKMTAAERKRYLDAIRTAASKQQATT